MNLWIAHCLDETRHTRTTSVDVVLNAHHAVSSVDVLDCWPLRGGSGVGVAGGGGTLEVGRRGSGGAIIDLLGRMIAGTTL